MVGKNTNQNIHIYGRNIHLGIHNMDTQNPFYILHCLNMKNYRTYLESHSLDR